jgi:anti-sigma regulatory factor (Ser/Thr protein kinase)
LARVLTGSGVPTREHELNEFGLRLELTSRAESVTVVRSVLTAVGWSAAIDVESMDDVRTAVSEACNNVVVHAYPDGEGTIVLSAAWDGRTLLAEVHDEGVGISHPNLGDEQTGLGLTLITALADRAEFASAINSSGTIVRMLFDIGARMGLPSASDPLSSPADLLRAHNTDSVCQIRGDIVMWLTPLPMLAGALRRLLRTVAGVSHFTIPGVTEITATSDAISTHASVTGREDWIGVGIRTAARSLNLAVAPLLDETARSVSAGAADIATSWDSLRSTSDGVRYERGTGYDILRVQVVDRHREPKSASAPMEPA